MEHAAGRLDAWARGTLTRVLGTTVLFDVDSTRAEQYLFLEHGHVQFPDYGIDVEGRNVAFRLRAGAAPERLQLSDAERRGLRREVDFLAEGVWRDTPFWRKPAFLIGAGVVVGVGALLLFTGDDGGPDTYRGTVSVPLPD